MPYEGADRLRAGSVGLTVDDFLREDYVIQLGYPPNRINILTSIKGLVFIECYGAGVQEEIDAVAVNFIDIDNLKKNKQASGRPQDLADIGNLK